MLKPLEKALEILGGQAQTAKILGIAQQTVSAWVNRHKRVSIKYAIPLEKLTEGKVNRHQLRPDVYPFE